MDEKDLVRMIKNSFAAKKSRAEILSGFQKRGYKLAYAEELIKKARRPTEILKILAICFIIFFAFGILFYTNYHENIKTKITNPLTNFAITKNIAAKKLPNVVTVVSANSKIHKTTYDKIKITPDFISYLLNEVGAWQLHKNPLTLEDPIINIKISGDDFHSDIGDKIKTENGLSDDADLEFSMDKKDLINAILSNNSGATFREYVKSGKVKVKTLTTKTELFAKGYFSLYDKLNN